MGNSALYIAFITERINSAFYLLAKTCNKHCYILKISFDLFCTAFMFMSIALLFHCSFAFAQSL